MRWREILDRLGEQVPQLLVLGWVADYPDPDNFLKARIGHVRQQSGRRNEGYASLVKRSQRSQDQGERMVFCREAQ